MAYDKVRGDIRVLYAHYRFSDHASTNIVLKDKSFGMEEVWFEGFMDWTFTRCIFSKSFHFGVEGARLSEDTRGTTGNPEPFPPYGSNGLHFNTCTFSKDFEIKDNCVVVFKDCTFSDEFTIEDNCKVEFIGCTFSKGITFKTFCDVRFIRCSLNMSDFGINAEGHCAFHFNNCTHGSPSDYFLSLTNDCKATFYSAEGITMTATSDLFQIDGSSTVKVYNYGSLISQEGDVVNISDGSKFEAHNVTTMTASKGNVFAMTGSEAFIKDVGTLNAPKQNVFVTEDSVIRGVNVQTISAEKADAIAITTSKMSLANIQTILSSEAKAINAINSELNVSTVDSITSAENIAMYLDGTTVSMIRDATLISSGENIAVYIQNGAWGQFENVATIVSGEATGMVVNNARLTDRWGELRQGKTQALNATGSTIEFHNIVDMLSGEGIAITMTGCVYHLSYVTNIVGKMGGWHVTTSRGVQQSTEKIESGEGTALILAGCSGPTEWDSINEISSPLMPAFVVSGDLYGFRASGLLTIESELAQALVWNQSGGEAYLSDINSITSPLEIAATFSVAGKLRVENVQAITSEQALALSISVTSGEAHFENVQSVTSEEADAMTVNVAEGALLRYNNFDSIESEMANCITGSVNGECVIINGARVSTQMGICVNLSGGAQGFLRLADIGVFQSDTASDDLVETSGIGHVQIHRIGEFVVNESSRYLCYISGPGGGFGRCEVIDCLNWSGSEVRGGLYIRDFFHAEAICSREKGSMDFEKATAVVLSMANINNGVIANWADIKDQSSEGYAALYVYGVSDTPSHIKIYNIDTVEGNVGADLASNGRVEVYNVGEIKSPDGDGPALSVTGGGTFLMQGGSGITSIEAKDNDTDAIFVSALNEVQFIKVETVAGKGSINIESTKHVKFHEATLRGTIKAKDSFVEFFGTETTSGYDSSDSVLEWTKSTLNVGQDDGERKDLLTEDCVCKFNRCVISGSEDIKFDDSQTFMIDVDGNDFTGDLGFQRATILMTASFNASNTALVEGALLLNSGFEDGSLVGGMISAHSSYKNVSFGDGVISTADSMDSLDISLDTGVILNKGRVDGDVTCGVSVGLIMNQGEVLGGLTLDIENAVIFNRAAVTGTTTFGEDNGIIGNYFTVEGAVSTAADTGLILNKASLTGALNIHGNSSALAIMTAVSGKLDIPTGSHALTVGVTASDFDLGGSAAFIGANVMPTGAGQGLVISPNDITGAYMPDLDGKSDLRTGIVMDSEMIHLFNEYGHTGYEGDGTTIALGAKAEGYFDSPQWSLNPSGQSRSGSYIIDLAAAIHHNLPEEGEIE